MLDVRGIRAVTFAPMHLGGKTEIVPTLVLLFVPTQLSTQCDGTTPLLCLWVRAVQVGSDDVLQLSEIAHET